MPESSEFDLPIRVTQALRVRFADDALDPTDSALARLMAEGHAARLLTFIDADVAAAWPDTQARLQTYLGQHGLAGMLQLPLRTVIAGEAIKLDPGHLLPLLQQIAEARIDRQSYVLVIGGGAVLDAVGFAAAVAHRGVRLIRMPTTTLAQADSGVGVKSGVNAFGQKNFIGTFAVPWGVVNSLHWLTSLPDREWRCGFSEAVKVSLLKDPALFDLVACNAERLRRRATGSFDLSAAIIRRSAILHAQHIATGGDPFEQGSARPLDFGHWAAHRLELMTGHMLRHGEAVSIGLALDCTYAARIGLLAQCRADAVIDVLARLGLPLAHPAMRDQDDLLRGLDDFREHLGGRLSITMLRDIGDAVEVHAIDRRVMMQCVADVLNRVPQTLIR
jgi:3-dehydroquinate synthase